jgi:serine/threonine protein kinase
MVSDQITGFLFALKMIKKEVLNEYEMEDQIAREIKTHYQMNHPNIVKMYGCHYDDKHIYLLLEYCE